MLYPFTLRSLMMSLLFSFPALISIQAQAIENMVLRSHIDFGEAGSGIWGHTDANGIEYAVIGTKTAIRILSLEDPSNPVERLVIPGANNSWREMRTWGNYIYVTTEGPDGVTIIDATNAPASFTWKRWKPAIPNTISDTLRTVHSINMDTLGYLYLNGHNVGSRGVIICDLNQDPYNPEIIANVGTIYTHDCYANEKYLFTADLGGGIGIYDLTDRSNPKFKTRFITSSAFAHNAWTSPDGKLLYTTDERSGAYLDVYDISDIGNIKFINKYRNDDSQLGSVIPHNTYAVGNYAVTSWYTDGILITDMTRPDNIVKVGEYDTYLTDSQLPANANWFFGCWGVYPYFKSGTIIGSDINAGLWVFTPTYQRACYLEGNVKLQNPDGSFLPLSGATISILSDKVARDQSDAQGEYKTGFSKAGIYKVAFDHPEFPKDTVEVSLNHGEVTYRDFIVQAQFLTGNVVDELGNAIGGAGLLLKNDETGSHVSATADTNGHFSFSVSTASNYHIQAAAWGFKGTEVPVNGLNGLTIKLKTGYEDDFFADLGWTVRQKAATGNWERVIPEGTQFQNNFANCNADDVNDIGNYAFVTGNGGGNVSDNDVDNGTTILVSPVFNFLNADSMTLTFSYWFFNAGGNVTPNDALEIWLHNGVDSLRLDSITLSLSTWRNANYTLSNDDIAITEKMQLVLKMGDTSPGHLVEAGLDKFRATPLFKTTQTDDAAQIDFTMRPNPTTGTLTIDVLTSCKAMIYDYFGRVISEYSLSVGSNAIDVSSIPSGSYMVKTNISNKAGAIKMVKL
ncbi:MAG: choice-of-anchor B family protein [Saprospiraceae bacterium]|nr:choice-of-anchor B family protein [Saprospiraceae bacterium]